MEKNFENIENKPKETRGGKREGSGRKQKIKGKKNFETRADFYKWVDDRWDVIMNAFDAHLTAKDKEMLKYILDQRIGKAAQAIDLTSDGDKLDFVPEVLKADLAILYSSIKDKL